MHERRWRVDVHRFNICTHTYRWAQNRHEKTKKQNGSQNKHERRREKWTNVSNLFWIRSQLRWIIVSAHTLFINIAFSYAVLSVECFQSYTISHVGLVAYYSFDAIATWYANFVQTFFLLLLRNIHNNVQTYTLGFYVCVLVHVHVSCMHHMCVMFVRPYTKNKYGKWYMQWH